MIRNRRNGFEKKYTMSELKLGVMSKDYGLAGIRVGWLAKRVNSIC